MHYSYNYFIAENITVIDVKLDQHWNRSMGVKGSDKFTRFADKIKLNVSVDCFVLLLRKIRN